jgi:hypothetical protein
MTRDELVLRAVHLARRGENASESRIYEDNAHLLVPDSLHRLAMETAMNAGTRARLIKEYPAVPISNGVVNLTADLSDVLIAGLPWLNFYDKDDPDRVNPYIFRHNYRDLDKWLNPNFGYCAVRDNSFLVTRQRGIQSIPSGKIGTPGPVVIIASYIPANDLSNLPAEMNDAAVWTLAEMLVGAPPEVAT